MGGGMKISFHLRVIWRPQCCWHSWNRIFSQLEILAALASSVRLVEVMVLKTACTKPWHIVCSVFTLMLVAEGKSLNRSSTRAVMSGLIRCSTSCAWQLVMALIPNMASARLKL
jgi:hypothetical protein